MYTQCPLYRCR